MNCLKSIIAEQSMFDKPVMSPEHPELQKLLQAILMLTADEGPEQFPTYRPLQ